MPRCNCSLISARCLSGANSISMAVMKETKPPTVVSLRWVCSKAMVTTQATATAASIWVIGAVALLAMVMRMA